MNPLIIDPAFAGTMRSTTGKERKAALRTRCELSLELIGRLVCPASQAVRTGCHAQHCAKTWADLGLRPVVMLAASCDNRMRSSKDALLMNV
ncbi:hypothetical protein FVF58_32355 [Paraburkholderia panacisoli]|uniref:Uncharacterized protein n=1 Tax=Paraburkholderia panacisoli TaxID=2603818 RepID=A0A5B0GPC3_9BURK|nr:hypothetical protein [Paraburkholderia panacisoli]KAA1004308.1 hypothetical protein FVF58_32355 [Paraburkholderia panacisoli]